jgi:nitrate/nitrite-specific signal transduction histidine kinase
LNQRNDANPERNGHPYRRSGNMSDTRRQQLVVTLADYIVFASAGLCVLGVGFHALTHLDAVSRGTTMVEVIALLCAIGLAVTYWWVRRRQLGPSTIRGRLLVGFVVICLLPAVAISAGAIIVGLYSGRQQAVDRLGSVAALREIEVNNWVGSLQNELVVALNEEYALERARIVLDLARDNKYYDYFNGAMRYRLQRFAEQSQQLEELFLVDLEGTVVVSSDVAQEGDSYDSAAYHSQGELGPYAQLPFGARGSEGAKTVVAIPVVTDDGEMLGILAGRAGVDKLNAILGARTGLGGTGKCYVVDPKYDQLPIGEASTPGASEGDQQGSEVHSKGIDAAINGQLSGSGVYRDYRGVDVVGAYTWMPELGVALLIEQDLSEAFSAIYANLALSVGIALGSVLLAVGVSMGLTRSIAGPLEDLVEAATQIAAGDTERVAKVTRQDEVGVLARAFNSMTAQLRELINSLEARVEERTRALRRRAVQLETSARVSREITSILDIDDLLGRVVELIRDAFSYYQVHIFLIDARGEELLMRASTASGRNAIHKLSAKGTSLNAEAARGGLPVLVSDVADDARYVPDERLPDVRSELVVPLRVGERVIGTLDVQSSQAGTFTGDDVLLMESLGDQIAIAIENARLYDQSRELATLEERNRLARELHDSISQSLFSLDLHAKAAGKYLRQDPDRAEAQLGQLRQLAREALEEMRTLIFDLRPPSLDEGGLTLALRQQVELLRRPDGPELVLHIEGNGRLPPDVQLGLLRVAQEALTNAMKHANAHRIEVSLSQDPARVTLCVEDDGCGFELSNVVDDIRCFGLRGMRERVAALGGRLEIISRPAEGTRVAACVPISGVEKRWSASAS